MNIVKSRVCGIIQEKAEILEVVDTTKFLGSYLNSITYIQFLVECEEVFEIEIDDDELDIMNFTDVQSVIDFIVKKMKESSLILNSMEANHKFSAR